MEVTLVDSMGSDLSVVNAARVSFGKKSEYEPLVGLKGKDRRLIKYLADHQHISPFHHTFITMHVKAPIFVARQLVKHEYMPWNEISRRYVDDEPEFYEPEVWRGRSEDKKQGSSNEVIPTSRYDYEVNRSLANWYRILLAENICPEQARMVLPQSTYTEWYWSGTLSAWAKMYNLRKKEDTQWETRQVALQAGDIIKDLYPVSWRALTNV